jgi:hypothetical protein
LSLPTPSSVPGDVLLDPRMTLEQMQAWCAYHQRVIHIDWRVVGFNRLPVAVVTEESDEVPMFLRPQAE